MLNNIAIHHDKDHIGILNGRQAVSNDEASPSLHELIKGILNQDLSPSIEDVASSKIKILGTERKTRAIVKSWR